MNFREYIEKKMGKGEFLNYWKTLNPNAPINILPKPHDHWGTTVDEDTIRITGSSQFIDCILSRLKDLINVASQDIEIDAKYEKSPYEHAGNPMTASYVFRFSTRYKNPAVKIAKGPIRTY